MREEVRNSERLQHMLEAANVLIDYKNHHSKRQKFLDNFRHAVKQAKDFKEGNVEFATWEDLMDEL